MPRVPLVPLFLGAHSPVGWDIFHLVPCGRGARAFNSGYPLCGGRPGQIGLVWGTSKGFLPATPPSHPVLWDSESKHLVTESGTKQLGGVDVEGGLSTGLWSQMGLRSNASSATYRLGVLE